MQTTNVRAKRPVLTERQQRVYDTICECIRTQGFPPTIREIGNRLGIRSTNGVADHLKALLAKGYLAQEGNKSRTLIPIGPSGEKEGSGRQGRTSLDEGVPFLGNIHQVAVPMLGRVAAGEPILALETADETMNVDPAWFGSTRNVFALRIKGNSMMEDGILDGDTVFVRQKQEADAGDIVVAIIDNEATVKRYYVEQEGIRLQPANRAMRPIRIAAEEAWRLRIAGIVVGVWRRLHS